MTERIDSPIGQHRAPSRSSPFGHHDDRRVVRFESALDVGAHLLAHHRIGDCDDEGVTLLASGALRRVLYSELRRAVVEVEFRHPPAAELAALDGARRHDLEEQ